MKSVGTVTSAEKEAYIKRVMADFSLSQKDAEDMWNKFMGRYEAVPVAVPSSAPSSKAFDDRLRSLFQKIDQCEDRFFTLLEKVDSEKLTPQLRIAKLQYSNIKKLKELTRRVDRLDGSDLLERVKNKQEEVLKKLREIEVKTQWIDKLRLPDLINNNWIRAQELAKRVHALENKFKPEGCVVCHASVSAKETELFSPSNRPICSKCYKAGSYVTASDKIAQVETKTIKSKEKRKISSPNVTDKDANVVLYFVALSGISEVQEREEEVLVEKVIKVKEKVIAPGNLPPKPVPLQGSVAIPKQLDQSQPPKVQPNTNAALEKEDTQVLYYMAMNKLLPASGGGDKQELTSLSPLDQVREILDDKEFSKYIDKGAVSAQSLNPTTSEQHQFLETWLQLYQNGSRQDIDKFVSQAHLFQQFGPLAYALKNVLFSKTFPRNEQK